MNRAPVLVVGAGPTGAVMAAELARHDAEVRVIERTVTRATESRAPGVHARSLEVLDQLGLADELVALGHRVRGFSFYARGRRILHLRFSHLESRFPFMLMVPQFHTQLVLDRHLERLGVDVERGVELVGLAQEGDGMRATVRHGADREETIWAPYVVGCDGAHSAVRHHLGLSFDGHGTDQDWLLADVEVDWPLGEDEVRVFTGPRGVLACLSFGDGRWRVMTPNVTDRPTERAAPDFDEMCQLVAERGPAGMTIAKPTWLACFRTHQRMTPHYRKGPVFLAGDAAHIHNPAAGQGMNTGLQDAHNLGWKLALAWQGQAATQLLDSYEAERTPVGAGVLQLTHQLVRIFNLPSPAGRALRNVMLPLLSRPAVAQRRATRRLGQTSVNYRTSPLAPPVGSRPLGGSRLRPGDRITDVDGLRVNGEATSLFRLIQHPGHTLLIFGAGDHPRPRHTRTVVAVADASSTPSTAGVVVDPDGELRRRLDAKSGSIILLRPDGYLAVHCRLGATNALDRYIDQVFTGRAVTGVGHSLRCPDDRTQSGPTRQVTINQLLGRPSYDSRP